MTIDYNDPVSIWRAYQKGLDQHNKQSLEENTEMAYRFYEGDQWRGLESGGEKLPCFNIIRPTVNYRSSMVSMNQMGIVYNPIEEDVEPICAELNDMAASQWERGKMDKVSWDAIKAACIAGDSYIYFEGSGAKANIIDTLDIFFADEQNPDIQGQKYIIIRERRFVDEVKKDADENGVKDIDMILADQDERQEKRTEVDPNAKCTCLVVFYKKDGVVHFLLSTRNVIYQPDTAILAQDEEGTEISKLTLYPIVSMIWIRKKDSTRGVGECKSMIPNQIEINRNLVRRIAAVKMTSFGKAVYSEQYIQNAEDLDKAGAAIVVRDGAAGSVKDYITYLNPISMSPDAHQLADELVTRTRDLAGAGDAAVGDVDPTKASGAAIIAVRDQAAVPLNEQTAAYQQMVEDIALVWLDIWAAYSTGGIQIEAQQGTYTVTPEQLRELPMMVKVDVTPVDPYSKFAVEQALEHALEGKFISFDEYVEALPEGSAAPKSKLQAILDAREQEATAEETLQQAMGLIQQLQAENQILKGGVMGGVSQMPS